MPKYFLNGNNEIEVEDDAGNLQEILTIAPKEESSWLYSTIAPALQKLPQLATAYGGVGTMLEDLILGDKPKEPLQPLSLSDFSTEKPLAVHEKIGSALREALPFEDIMNAGLEAQQDIQPNLNKGSLNYYSNVGGQVGASYPEAMLAAGLGGPAGAAAYFGLNTLGQEYAQATKEGYAPEAAREAALFNGLVQAGFSLPFINSLIKPSPNMLKNTLKLAGSQALEEGATGTAKVLSDISVLGKGYSGEDIQQMAKDAALRIALGSGTFGPLTSLIPTARNSVVEDTTPPLRDMAEVLAAREAAAASLPPPAPDPILPRPIPEQRPFMPNQTLTDIQQPLRNPSTDLRAMTESPTPIPMEGGASTSSLNLVNVPEIPARPQQGLTEIQSNTKTFPNTPTMPKRLLPNELPQETLTESQTFAEPEYSRIAEPEYTPKIPIKAPEETSFKPLDEAQVLDQELMKAIDIKPEETAPTEQEPVKEKKRNPFGFITNERGFVANPLDSVAKTLDSWKARRKVIEQVEEGHIPASKETQWISGSFGDKLLWGLSPVRSAFNVAFKVPKRAAEKFPAFGELFNSRHEQARLNNRLFADSMEASEAFNKLTGASKDKVTSAFWQLEDYVVDSIRNGRRPQVDEGLMREMNLTDPEIDAIQRREETSQMEWNRLMQALRKQSPDATEETQEDWNRRIDELERKRIPYYVPHLRRGKYMVEGFKLREDGNINPEERYVSFEESEWKAKRKAAKLIQESYGGVTHGQRELSNLGELRKLGPKRFVQELTAEMQDTITPNETQDNLGYRGHLLRRRYIAGQHEDLQRAFANYSFQNARYVSHLEHYNENLKAREAAHESPLADYAKRWEDWLDSPDGIAGTGVRNGLTNFYLGFYNPRPAALNLTQPISTAYGELSKYTKDSGKSALMETFKGYVKGFLYIKDPETFQRRYPEMYAAMKEAEKEGVISSENVQALKGVASGERKYGNEQYAFQPDDSLLRKAGRVVSSELERGMGLMAGSEKASRAVAYVMAYENAPEGVDKKTFSKNFVDDTMFVYDKINQPQIAQGPVANVVALFKMFPLNWLSLFRRNISQGQYGAAARMLGATMAMGGIRALPFAKPAIGIAKGLGYQPETAIREALGPEHEKLADAIIYGIPAAITPFNISGASAPADIVPDPERGLAEAVASSMGGIPFGFAMRAGGAIDNISKGGDISRSVEMVLPDTIKNAVSGARAASNQAFTDLRGNDVLPVEGIVEPMTRMLGMQPTALTKSYELLNAEKEIAQTTKDLAVNDDIGRALARGDIEQAKIIVQKARAHNIKYKDQPEMQIKLDGAAIKKIAKLSQLPAWMQVILTSPKRSRGAQIERARQTPSIIGRKKANQRDMINDALEEGKRRKQG